MRFGISATSWIFPKNLRTRLRPVNVCAISSLALSILSETAGAGSRLNPIACTDGEDRFGAESPATGSNLETPVRRTPAPGGQDLRSAVLPAFVKRKVRTAGRNRRFPDVKPGRQPERACSGSSG